MELRSAAAGDAYRRLFSQRLILNGHLECQLQLGPFLLDKARLTVGTLKHRLIKGNITG
jgi:hypothetical protein